MVGERLLTLGVAGCAVAWIVRCTRRRVSITRTLSKEDLRQGFIRVLQECDTIIINNLPILEEKLCTLLDTDYFVTALRDLPKSNAPEKRRLWAQLKATAFSRLYAAVVSAAYLSVIARVHIAIVKGLAAASAQRNQDVPPHFPDPVVHFVHYGLPSLCSDIHKAVSQEMEDVLLNHRLNRQDFKIMLKRVEMGLKSVLWNMTEYVMPSVMSGYTDESMMALHDILGSREVKAVLDNLVAVEMAYMSRILSTEIAWTDEDNGLEDVVRGGEVVAKIIPVVSHSIHSSFIDGKDGMFYQIMTDKDLTKLTGNVYECFSV